MKMKCILVEQVGSFTIAEVPVPEPGAGEVLIRVEVAGLCRTDLKLIRVGHRDLVLPRIPAEEVVGAVKRVGDGVSRVQVGDRVYVYPGVWCGQCRPCRMGAENMCRDMRILGFHRDGGFAEYLLAPAQSLIPVPQGLDSEQAVFAEPLSCCLNALEMAGLSPGMRVGIWGAGPAGTLLNRAARAHGAEPFNIEPDPGRRARAAGYAQPPGLPFDVAVVAVGSRAAYESALQHLSPRGRLVVFSGLPPEDRRLAVDFNQLHYLEQTVVGAYGCSYRHGEQALRWIADGAVAVRDLISHRMSLWELDQALSLVENRQSMKILLFPN